MKESNYVYKVKVPYLKQDKILKYGFNYYESDLEKDNELIYAIPVLLDLQADIPQAFIKIMNDKKFLAEADLSELEKAGIYYCINNNGEHVIDLEKSELEKICLAHLCVAHNTGDFTEGMLFLNDPSNTPYYNKKILDSHCPEIINDLFEKGIIYKKLVKEE